MHFNDLHLEIIRMIFYIHVYEHLGSKRTLLHTCRTWYNLASNDPILWKDIILIAWEGKYPLLDRCKTLDDLLRDISRTRNGIFNLTLKLPATPLDEGDFQRFTANMDRKWLSRCRSLTLRTPTSSNEDIGNQIQRTVDVILSPKRSHFTALEHLSIHDNPWGRALDSLLGRVGRSSPNLQSLELAIRYNWEPCDIATRVFRHVDILRRIRRLHLGSVTVPVPWVEFTHMEHLDYTCIDVTVDFGGPEIRDSSNLSELVAPCLTSLCLEGEFEDIELPSHNIFNQITHLVLRDFSYRAGALPSSFLHLSSLGTQTRRSYHMNIPIDAAPNLEELTLAAYCIDLKEYDTSTKNLTPRVLRLDIVPLQKRYINFGRPHELWSRLEELHLTVRENVTFSLTRILERALCNETLSASGHRWSPLDLENWHPQLHTLTVLYPYDEQEPTEAVKRRNVEQVRGVLAKRCASSLDPLETVKVGWYKVARGTFVLGRPFTEWTVIEWRDCLDDWKPSDYLEDMPELDVEVLDSGLETEMSDLE